MSRNDGAELFRCKQRGEKGPYKQKKSLFIGIGFSSEAPEQPELIVNTHGLTLKSIQKMLNRLMQREVITGVSKSKMQSVCY